MAKFDLKFLDCVDEDNHISVKHRRVVYSTDESKTVSLDTILIRISFEGVPSYIDLDKSTAIKLAKTIRTEINKMEDETNG
jgi:hypothetical protein